MIFDRIVSWIRKVVNAMIGKTTLNEALGVDIALNDAMITALRLWTEIYENRAPWLKEDEVESLNLGVAISSEVARIATIEMGVEIEGSKRADFLALQFEKVMDKLRDGIEFGCAKGGLILKPYVVEDELNVDFVHADQFFPIEFGMNGRITSAIFVDQRQRGSSYFTRLEFHKMDPSGYIVKNVAYKSSAKDDLGTKTSLTVIDDWKDLAEEATVTGVLQPLYAYFRYPFANNIDPTSPLGVSCYSRATNLIKAADKQWSDFLWEFDSARRALYVDVSAFDKDSSGKPVLPHKRFYRTLNQMDSAQVGDEGFFKEWSPDIREQNMLNGLDRILKQIEFTCGLAYGTLSDPNSVEKTATEIANAKQRSYSTVTDVQKSIEAALDDLLYAMDVWATVNKLAPKGKYNVSYEFDDSIVVDKDAQFQQDLRLVTTNVMSRLEFRMRNMGENEETAKKMLEMVNSERQETDLFEEENRGV